MTRSNRTLNRALLALAGLMLLALAAVGIWPVAARLVPGLLSPADLGLGATALRRGAEQPLVLGAIAAVALLLVVLAVAWAVSRGRGGTADVVRGTDGDAIDAGIEIDIHTVRELLGAQLDAVPSVLGVDANAYRLRGRTALRVTVRTRRHADLPALAAAVRASIADLDAALGIELPVVVRLVTGLRAQLAREQRAE